MNHSGVVRGAALSSYLHGVDPPSAARDTLIRKEGARLELVVEFRLRHPLQKVIGRFVRLGTKAYLLGRGRVLLLMHVHVCDHVELGYRELPEFRREGEGA